MKKNTKLQKCWIWDATVEEFVKSRIRGRSLNICAGKSSVGDVKIDLDPQDRSVIKGDMKSLSFADNTFDTGVWNPGETLKMRTQYDIDDADPHEGRTVTCNGVADSLIFYD